MALLVGWGLQINIDKYKLKKIKIYKNMSNIIENIGSAMTLCEYVMLNGRETNWRSVHETISNYALEDVAVEELPETEEEDFCYISIRETLIEIINMFRLGGGYKYTDSGVVMLIRLFTKLYEELMDIVDPDDIEEEDNNIEF